MERVKLYQLLEDAMDKEGLIFTVEKTLFGMVIGEERKERRPFIKKVIDDIWEDLND